FFSDLAQRQIEIQGSNLTNIQMNFFGRFLKAGLLRGNRVIAGWKGRDLVIAHNTTDSRARESGASIGGGYGCVWNGGATGVVHPPLDRNRHNLRLPRQTQGGDDQDRKSTRLNSSHVAIS